MNRGNYRKKKLLLTTVANKKIIRTCFITKVLCQMICTEIPPLEKLGGREPA